ncbi:MAG TPA: NAD(P)-dependent oxidoreductase [Phycisphaerae bacterium]|nr:NAD(P)-dependent oxidoreductase [Phycisphaerae bacterium]HNU45750.1 NAD(P)-dependent oxidoreductase [Phycisphaerae bacterium]
MRVLVTGHRGYLGSVLTCVLRHARFEVVGLDTDLFAGCDFGSTTEPVEHFDCDVRDVDIADLCSFDAVIHLAGLSDEAGVELDPALAEDINLAATVRLIECCKLARVPRLLFASSCAVYGCGGNELLHEEGPVRPQSRYAALKLQCEQALLAAADSTFSPVILRNAFAYGVSPRLRTDLLVNDFTAAGLATGRVTLVTAGRAWQPLVHVADLAQVYATVLLAPDELVHGQIFNVVHSCENYRIIDVADAVTDWVPLCERQVLHGGFDPHSFRVDGGKLERTFPRLKWRWTLPLGIRQLVNAMTNAGMSPGTWRSDRYRRALRLQALREQGQVDAALRRGVSVHTF